MQVDSERSGVRFPVTILLAALALSCGGSAGDPDAERMAVEHAGDRPVPSDAAATAPSAAVHSAGLAYAMLDGRPVLGHVAAPDGEVPGLPGIIVIHEWWGLNDNIRAMAERLAGEGYVTLAVDLYRGEVAADPARARELMSAASEREAELLDNLRQAQAYLSARTGGARIGVIGWCFGGAWSLRTALTLGDGIAATVIYYGHPITDREALAPLASPVLGHFGGADGGIPLDDVRAFEQALADRAKPAEIHVYQGAEHAFANPSGTRYDAAAAEQAWTRTLGFFARHLKP